MASGGAVLLVQRFDAYGQTVTSGGTLQTPIGYRGERYDATLGQYYLRARFYDPRSGRFTAMDPYAGNLGDPLQLMRYGYAGANPVWGMDPSGKWTTSQLAAATAIGTVIINTAITAWTFNGIGTHFANNGLFPDGIVFNVGIGYTSHGLQGSAAVNLYFDFRSMDFYWYGSGEIGLAPTSWFKKNGRGRTSTIGMGFV